jgi:O-antigen/teichoic acid export membrane protein
MSDPAPPQPAEVAAVGRAMAVGSGLMVAMRWAVRGIGLISTMILARLLTPQDFGLVAKAMLVIGMLEIMAETGQRLAIIRHAQPTRAHYDTAWTIGIIVNGSLAVAMFIAAPLAQLLFHEPAAVPLVRVLAFRTLLNGMENIGTVDFRRNMQFAKDFQYNLASKALSFIVTISLAFYFRNYVALVGAIVAGQLILVILSYIISPYRPRFSLAAAGEIWSFSIWVLVSSTGNYLLSRLDQWVLSTQASASLMGKYTVGSELAQLPLSEVIAPATRALYPAYCRLYAKSLEEMTEALVTNLRFVAIVCASAGVGIACVSRDFTLVLLGSQWSETSQFIVYIALASAIYSFNGCAAATLNVTGHVRIGGVLAWTRVAIAAPCILLGFRLNGALGVAQSLLIADILFTPGMYYEIMKTIPLSLKTILSIVWRPLSASAVMAAVLLSRPFAHIAPASLRLLLEVTSGAATFTAALYLLWLASGRPAGGEAFLVNYFQRLMRPAMLPDVRDN